MRDEHPTLVIEIRPSAEMAAWGRPSVKLAGIAILVRCAWGKATTEGGSIKLLMVGDEYCLIRDPTMRWPRGGCVVGSDKLIATAVLIGVMLGIPGRRLIGAPGVFARAGLEAPGLTSAEIERAPLAIRQLAERAIRSGETGGVAWINSMAFANVLAKTAFLRETTLKMSGGREYLMTPSAVRMARCARAALRRPPINRLMRSIGPLCSVGPGRRVGERVRMRTGDGLDGLCARIMAVIAGQEWTVGGARAYRIMGAAGDDWYLLGDPVMADFVRDNEFHDELVATRIVGCCNELSYLGPDLAAARTVLAPGRYAYKAASLGLRELEEMPADAPEALRREAEISQGEAGRYGMALRSGLFCVDQARLEDLMRRRVPAILARGSAACRAHVFGMVGRVSTAVTEPLRGLLTTMPQDWGPRAAV